MVFFSFWFEVSLSCCRISCLVSGSDGKLFGSGEVCDNQQNWEPAGDGEGDDDYEAFAGRGFIRFHLIYPGVRRHDGINRDERTTLSCRSCGCSL